MYERLGFQWASTLLAFLSLLFVPIPIWWFYKGRSLRMKSPFARFVTKYAMFCEREADLFCLANISTKTRMRHTRIETFFFCHFVHK